MVLDMKKVENHCSTVLLGIMRIFFGEYKILKFVYIFCVRASLNCANQWPAFSTVGLMGAGVAH